MSFHALMVKRGARFSHVWKLSSFLDSNGTNDYFNIKIEHVGSANPAIYGTAVSSFVGLCEPDTPEHIAALKEESRIAGLLEDKSK